MSFEDRAEAIVMTTVVGVDEAEAATTPASPSFETHIGASTPHDFAKVIVVEVILEPVRTRNALSFPATKVQFASQAGLFPDVILCPFVSISKMVEVVVVARAKRAVVLSPLCTDNFAKGLVVPMPTLPPPLKIAS